MTRAFLRERHFLRHRQGVAAALMMLAVVALPGPALAQGAGPPLSSGGVRPLLGSGVQAPQPAPAPALPQASSGGPSALSAAPPVRAVQPDVEPDLTRQLRNPRYRNPAYRGTVPYFVLPETPVGGYTEGASRAADPRDRRITPDPSRDSLPEQPSVR